MIVPLPAAESSDRLDNWEMYLLTSLLASEKVVSFPVSRLEDQPFTCLGWWNVSKPNTRRDLEFLAHLDLSSCAFAIITAKPSQIVAALLPPNQVQNDYVRNRPDAQQSQLEAEHPSRAQTKSAKPFPSADRRMRMNNCNLEPLILGAICYNAWITRKPARMWKAVRYKPQSTVDFRS